MVMVTSILYKMRPARLKAKRRLERELARIRLADRLAGRQAGRQAGSPGDRIIQYVKTLGEVRDSLNYTGEDEPLATWYGWNEFHEYCMRTYRSGNAPWPESEPRLLVIGDKRECARLHGVMMYKSANPGFRMTESDTGERPGNVAEAMELFGDLSVHMGLDECLVYAWDELTVDDLCVRVSGNPDMCAEALTSSYAVPPSYTPPVFQAVGSIEIPRFTAEQDHIRLMGRDEASTSPALTYSYLEEELGRTLDRQWMLDQWRCCPRTVGTATASTTNAASATNTNAGATYECGDASTASATNATNATSATNTNASATYEWNNCGVGCDGAPF